MSTAAETVYTYEDEEGHPQFEVVRPPGQKRFFQRRPDGTYDLNSVRRVPYRLRELLAGIRARHTIFVVEGEKDVDRLRALGYIATTNPGGTGSTKLWAEFAPLFQGARRVVILPDNDNPGRARADYVADCLSGIVPDIRIVHLPVPPKGDVSDWVDAGGDKQQLEALIQAAAVIRTTPETEPGIVRLADVAPQPVHWLWANRLPRGKIVLLDGNPQIGKSLITCDLAARITTGQPFPDAYEARPPQSVLFLASEDGLADTIRPRIDAAGADPARVIVMEDTITIPDDLNRVERIITQEEVALLVVDPLVAFLGEKTNSWRDQDIRRALLPLKQMAERTGVCVFAIRHLSKGGAGSNPLYAGGGSIGIIGQARSAFLAAEHPEDRNIMHRPRRVFACTKNNLGPRPTSLLYRVTDAPGIEWEGPTAYTAGDLLGGRA
jgi:putative DNA primase/helicase